MHAFTQVLTRIAAKLSLASLLLAGAGLVAMTVMVAWGVFGRYVLNDTPTWVEAMSLWLMAWFILLGASVGVRESDHLGFEVGLALSPPPLRAALIILTELLVGMFGLAMLLYGAQLAIGTWSDRMPIIGISRGWDYIPMAAGGGLIALFSLEKLMLFLTKVKAAPLGFSHFSSAQEV
ncbi:TRAP transporter small permease [Bosea sp. (in: a-proteobacteria)]|jgi:TRAP-type C4-dicarboxylate transport system permease small subunit|uniref:TRAP transporter small permease n=1 Tax=Bosea sp. (in: a-proteobacteria) TaxID=1871050 RepID=UPI003F70D751